MLFYAAHHRGVLSWLQRNLQLDVVLFLGAASGGVMGCIVVREENSKHMLSSVHAYAVASGL